MENGELKMKNEKKKPKAEGEEMKNKKGVPNTIARHPI
jgi:hypothetical protein